MRDKHGFTVGYFICCSSTITNYSRSHLMGSLLILSFTFCYHIHTWPTHQNIIFTFHTDQHHSTPQRPTSHNIYPVHTHEHEAWSVTQPPMCCSMYAKPQTPVVLRAMYCSIHFLVIETCVSKPKQFSLPVVLFPKKGANKYSQPVYSLSVTLQHSHLQFWIRSSDQTETTFILASLT